MASIDRSAGARGVTLADVAAHVGVSARTVSRVVNDEGGCTPATKARIEAAIEELGYRPNLMARALIRRRSDTIGLINQEMLDPFFPEFADGVQEAAAENRRTMFVASSGGNSSRQRQMLTSFLGLGVDGAIVFPAADSGAELARFARDGLPIVTVNAELSIPGVSSVTAEIEHGAQLAVNHLVETGRRRIAMLIDATADSAPKRSRRRRGYHAALDAAGLSTDEELLIPVENSFSGGREGARRALALAEPPAAIFAYNDVIAVGALQQCLALGVRVPDDIAIVGFDDISMCEAMTPSLSTIRIDRDLLGRSAVEALQQLVETGIAESRRIPVELVARDSS